MNKLLCFSLISVLGLSSKLSMGQEQNNNALFSMGNELMIKGLLNFENSSLEDIQDKSNGHIKNPSITEARAIWKQYLEKDPTNADANFKMGLCYIITYDEKAKALPFFMLSIKNMSPAHYSFRTSTGQAPAYALYFLAEAFIENNQPDSALKYFALYKDQYQVPPMNADREVFMCINARNSLKQPGKLKAVNISSLNSGYAETNPVVKADNSMIFFSSRRPSKGDTGKAASEHSEDIYYASRDASGKWGEPVPFKYNTDLDEAPLCISPDGEALYFRRFKNFNDDIYFSKFKDGEWAKPQAFSAINSRFNESGLSFSSDGKTLYFSSDRPGGMGGYDIYKCLQNEKGKWSSPLNLGYPVNSTLNEIDPNLDQDGKILFFSSNGNSASGIGGQDIYSSECQSATNKWSEPRNIGYPVNTTRDDINYCNAGAGKRYYSRINEGQSYDLFEIVAGDPDTTGAAAARERLRLAERLKALIADSAASSIVSASSAAAKAGENGSKANENGVKANDSGTSPDANDQTRSMRVIQSQTVYFEYDKIHLTKSASKDLRSLVSQLKKNPAAKVEIVGHTDIKGKWKYNVVLSEKRALEVKDYLVKHAISEDRLLYYGRGSLAPKTSNDTDENRSKNRRVEITIIE